MKWLTMVSCLVALGGVANAPQAAEVKGGWVTAWNDGLFTREQVDATVATAKSVGLNALFIQVRKVGDAYYESSMEPRGDNMAPDFDSLAYAIEKAHSEGMQVHAWVNVCRIWRDQNVPTDSRHIVNAHPEWLSKTVDGKTRAAEGLFMDPGVPAAREYTAALCEDIVRRYDVDGIHLDYIRYPGDEWGYNDEALARYYGETGTNRKPSTKDARWCEWRRQQVTEQVRLISEKIHAVKPKVVLSAATIAWGPPGSDFGKTSPYCQVFQDWKTWAARGYLDAIIPMNYKNENSAKTAQQFRDWLGAMKRWSSGKPVYVGVDVHSNDSSGAVRQVHATKNAKMDGFVLFSFNPSSKRNAVVRAMNGTPYESQVVCEVSSSVAESQAAFEKGIKFASVNQVGMAIVQLKKAVELDNCNVEAHYRLGRCYLKERNKTKAEQCFTRALEIDPMHDGAREELEALKDN